jgi:hypothetical protein
MLALYDAQELFSLHEERFGETNTPFSVAGCKVIIALLLFFFIVSTDGWIDKSRRFVYENPPTQSPKYLRKDLGSGM